MIGFTNGKWILKLTFLSKLQRFFFPEKLRAKIFPKSQNLLEHSDQNEQSNCVITETPNYYPKTNNTNDLQSFH